MRRSRRVVAAMAVLAAGVAAVVHGGGSRSWAAGSTTVTTLQDAGSGSIRAAVAGGGVVTFASGLSGTIVLGSPLLVPSGTTIDGSGADVTLTRHGLVLKGVDHVTIRNLTFDGNDATTDTDAIQILGASTDVVVEHDTFGAAIGDGAVDATQGSTRVRLSWNHFVGTVKTLLLGHAAQQGTPPLVDMTVDHNWFDGTDARAPMVRHGRFYVYDNVIDRFGPSGGSSYGTKIACGAMADLVDNAWIAATNLRGLVIDASDCDPTRPPAVVVQQSYVSGLPEPQSVRSDLVTWPTSVLPTPDPMTVAYVDTVRSQAGAPPGPGTATSSTTSTDPTSSTSSTTATTSTTTGGSGAVPGNVALVRANATTVTLSWSAVAGATDYRWTLLTCTGALVVTNHTATGLAKSVDHLGPGCYQGTVTAKVGGAYGPPGISGQVTLT